LLELAEFCDSAYDQCLVFVPWAKEGAHPLLLRQNKNIIRNVGAPGGCWPQQCRLAADRKAMLRR
jgi:hypothetical protein